MSTYWPVIIKSPNVLHLKTLKKKECNEEVEEWRQIPSLNGKSLKKTFGTWVEETSKKLTCAEVFLYLARIWRVENIAELRSTCGFFLSNVPHIRPKSGISIRILNSTCNDFFPATEASNFKKVILTSQFSFGCTFDTYFLSSSHLFPLLIFEIYDLDSSPFSIPF